LFSNTDTITCRFAIRRAQSGPARREKSSIFQSRTRTLGSLAKYSTCISSYCCAFGTRGASRKVQARRSCIRPIRLSRLLAKGNQRHVDGPPPKASSRPDRSAMPGFALSGRPFNKQPLLHPGGEITHLQRNLVGDISGFSQPGGEFLP